MHSKTDSGLGQRYKTRCMDAACCVMRDAGSFCYRNRHGLDVKPLLSHGGLECIAVVIDSHMRHQGAPLHARVLAGLFVCLFANCRDATGSPHPLCGVYWAVNVSCNRLSVRIGSLCIGSLCGSPATAPQECCGWR